MCAQLGSTAIGVTTPHGVVLAVEKRITSPLLVRDCRRNGCSGPPLHLGLWHELMPGVPLVMQEPSSIQKIMEIDTHLGCAMSGLTADAKTLIDHARAETQVRSLRSAGTLLSKACWDTLRLPEQCFDTLVYLLALSAQQHRFTYNEAMPVESITQSLCDLALRFGEDSEESMVRHAGIRGHMTATDWDGGPGELQPVRSTSAARIAAPAHTCGPASTLRARLRLSLNVARVRVCVLAESTVWRSFVDSRLRRARACFVSDARSRLQHMTRGSLTAPRCIHDLALHPGAPYRDLGVQCAHPGALPQLRYSAVAFTQCSGTQPTCLACARTCTGTTRTPAAPMSSTVPRLLAAVLRGRRVRYRRAGGKT